MEDVAALGKALSEGKGSPIRENIGRRAA